MCLHLRSRWEIYSLSSSTVTRISTPCSPTPSAVSTRTSVIPRSPTQDYPDIPPASQTLLDTLNSRQVLKEKMGSGVQEADVRAFQITSFLHL